MKILVLTLVSFLFFGCSQQSNTDHPKELPAGADLNACRLEIKSNMKNGEIATEFSRWRSRCNPSEENFLFELKKL